MKDIAKAADVSPMTVSRVLSGGKNVRPQVREHVERVIAEVGYHRNENARRLRQGERSGLIGVLITNIGNPYYAGMLQGVEQVVAATGRRVMVGLTNEDADLEKQLVLDFLGRQVEGLIVVPVGQDPVRFAPERLGGVPLVLASRSFDGSLADAVLLDDVRGAFEATRRMLEEGHRRIAYLGNRVSVATGRRRLEGFESAHRELGFEPAPDLVRLGQQDADSAERAMDDLLDLADPPTAVFAANNRNSVGVIRSMNRHRAEARRAGVELPTLRLFGFDSFEFADMSPIPLSIVDHDPSELGRIAAKLLFDRLEGESQGAPARLVELPVRLVDFS
ncbi:LacI family DNA-binding transcriptional regulator [Frondihabitans sp. PAMC 28766]|uniref:LacI family DNA-binding transcriptional regulator n=1 Tax=Frondihabitans sp. PAMC 28766 TaxID=1795630 RepID=UPI000B11474A|nr:LacI family DNA-binding transcriptional regulator [Frondihabitans sp. PAMC 28766]